MEDETMKSLHQAAIALGNEARRRGAEPILPFAEGAEDTTTAEAPVPLLVEAKYHNGELTVAMPNGETWRYNLVSTAALPFKRVLLACIDPTTPRQATVFAPGAEGIHPFAGVAARFGVERSVA